MDTNVLVLAEGIDTPPFQCQSSCAEALQNLVHSGAILIDDEWRILKEYESNLRLRGQPGVGQAFLKWLHSNLGNTERCQQVSLTERAPNEFDEFPATPELSNFDPDDRKFVAVARAHEQNPLILVAIDRDWWIARSALERAGIALSFLCLEEMDKKGSVLRRIAPQ